MLVFAFGMATRRNFTLNFINKTSTHAALSMMADTLYLVQTTRVFCVRRIQPFSDFEFINKPSLYKIFKSPIQIYSSKEFCKRKDSNFLRNAKCVLVIAPTAENL